MAVEILTYVDKTIRAQYDAILYSKLIGNGTLYGMETGVVGSGANVEVTMGFGIIEGRVFRMDATSIPVDVVPGEHTNGQIIIHMDLSNTETPIQFIADNTMRALTQDSDFNIANGVWEEQLCTFSANGSTVFMVVQTFKEATGALEVLNTLESKEAAIHRRITSLADSTVYWETPVDPGEE